MTHEVVCLSTDDRDRWLAERRKGVTSSVAAQLLGCQRFGSLLGSYLYLRGARDDEPLTDWMEWGRIKQEPVIKYIRTRTGYAITESEQLIRSTTEPWMLATLDAWVRDPDDGTMFLPCEIKTSSSPSQLAAWQLGPPPDVAAQVQWQLAITGARRALAVAELMGGPPVHAWVDRDETTIGELIDRGREFWGRVQRGDPPPPDGSDDAADALSQMHPTAKGTRVDLDIRAVEMTEELAAIETSIRDFETRKAVLRQTIRAAMGDAEIGQLPGDAGKWRVITAERKPFVQVSGVGLEIVRDMLAGSGADVAYKPGSTSSHIRLGK